MEKQKAQIDFGVVREFHFFKGKLLASLVLFYLITFFLVWKFGWQCMEPWVWVASAVLAVFSFSYILVKEKTINPLEFLSRKKQYIQNKKYRLFGFEQSEIDKMKEEVGRLTLEINSIKNNVR